MGGTVTSYEVQRRDVHALLPRNQRFLALPKHTVSGPPRTAIACLHALPSGITCKTQNTDGVNLTWSIDCRFMPYSDCELVISIDNYIQRPHRTPLHPNTNIQGQIYKLQIAADRYKYKLFPGARTSTKANVWPAPNGNHICYVGRGCVVMQNCHTMETVRREKDSRINCYQHCCISSDGNYIATVARIGFHIEVSLLFREPSVLFQHGSILCHSVCPEFTIRASRYQAWLEHCECKFSPDSQHIAVASSFGMLLVLKRGPLGKHCNIVPGVLDTSAHGISSYRCFDFDPKEPHKIIAYGSKCGTVFIVNTDEHKLEKILQTSDDQENDICCLQYRSDGDILAVARQRGIIEIFDPNMASLLYKLDATAQTSETVMTPMYGDVYPEVTRMSFSYSGHVLAVASSDGYIRLWQLEQDLHLLSLCRLVILQHADLDKICKLPLPVKLLTYLLCNTYTTRNNSLKKVLCAG